MQLQNVKMLVAHSAAVNTQPLLKPRTTKVLSLQVVNMFKVIVVPVKPHFLIFLSKQKNYKNSAL